ncbi:Beta subunit 1 of SnRK1 [Thoreauomyces humboldtii]|nr:Beta subunit 1 of SnRK1 [Thoreauomyces humboldtii]
MPPHALPSSSGQITHRRTPPSFIELPRLKRISTLQRVLFRWHHSSATRVILTGTFDNWKQSIVVPRDSNYVDEFSIVLVLDRLVRHEFKFLVDGEWRCSYAFPTSFDESGFVNNCIEAVSVDTLSDMAFEQGGFIGKRRTDVPSDRIADKRARRH